tara:strand:+ start:2316 stop:5858 length:3543 start_codon:yes stop_codon:yes gene_type:complete
MSRILRKNMGFDPTQSFITQNDSVYSAHAANSIELWYNFPSGSTTTDALGKRDGTTINGADIQTFSDSPFTSLYTNFDSIGFEGGAGNGKIQIPLTDLYSHHEFSIAFWHKSGDVSSAQYLFDLGGDTGAFVRLYNNTDNFQMKDNGWGTTAGLWSIDNFWELNQWIHVVVTFNRKNAGYNPTIYKNGVKQTIGSTTSPAGTRTTLAGTSEFPSGGNGPEGIFNNLLLWTKELTSEDVRAVYEATATVHPASVSGIISNPVRILLQTEDNRTGSYPTIARAGDHDFTGKFPSIFDDSKTIDFGGKENIVYPTGLDNLSPFVSGGVATPNILGGITAPGTSSAGVSDLHARFTPGENISPFDESRVYIDESMYFYSTGTATGTMPGFSQRLASKESIVIDCNPTAETTVVFSTGTQPSASGYDAGVNSGLAYYNFESSHWNVVGDLTTGSSVDYNNSQVSLRTGSYLAMSPSLYSKVSITPGNIRDFNEGIGSPIDYAGFPYATKFNATSSQLYNTSASIDSPFLIEKVTFEFSGSIGTTPWGTSTSPEQNMNSTFMLLLQRENPVSEIVESSVDAIAFQAYSGGYYPTVTTGTQFEVTRDKRIIWYGRIGRFGTTWGSYDDFKEGANEFIQKSCDLWIPGTTLNYNFGGDNLATSGTFRIESVPQVPSVQYPISVPLSTRVRSPEGGGLIGQEGVSFGRKSGGRDLRGQSDGRSFIRPFSGEKILSSSIVNNFFSGQLREMHRYQDESVDSPFLLLPGDRLVLAYANQNMPYALFEESISTEYSLVHYRRTLLSPGAGKLTLYGSYLRDSLPKEGQTNQPLNTAAIHESLQSDIPVYDQWDVEPYVALSGSYVDNMITGSMLVKNYSEADPALWYTDPTHIPNVRQVQFSVAAGEAGDQGSLQRFVRTTDNERFSYDSIPPNAVNVIIKNGFGLFHSSSSDIMVSVASPSNAKSDSLGAELKFSDNTWYLRHAYEQISKRFVRDSFYGEAAEAFNASNTSKGIRKVSQILTAHVIFSGSAGEETVSGDGFGNRDNRHSFNNAVKWMFGFGDGPYNMPVNADAYRNNTTKPLIRGYKYGLSGLFGSRQDARFRRDKFGQFRDMLEPRRHTATVQMDGLGKNFVIDVIFVPRDSIEGGTTPAEKTHSHNLDSHASASLPYYDGLFVDRPDNPDESLKIVDIT